MDFTNIAGIEFVQAIEAQREHDRNQKKWLFQWKDLRRAADERQRAQASADAARGGDNKAA